jgi:hypothetical protein
MNQVQETLEASAAALGTKATWTGSAVTVVGGLSHSDIGLWSGIAIGVVGLVLKWWFESRADRRSEERHRAYLASLNTKDAHQSPEDGEKVT